MADYKPGSVPLEQTDDRRLFCKFHYKGFLILFIPIAFGGILAGHPVLVCRFLYLTICMYLYYILNVMARGATAFIYSVFIPIAGIADSGGVSNAYYTDLLYLVYGTVWLGILMESSRLSEHLGFLVIRMVGTSLIKLQVVLTCLVFVIAFLVDPTLGATFGMKVAQAVVVEYNAANIIKMDSDEPRYEPGSKPYPTRPAIGIFLTCCYTAPLAASISPFVHPNSVIAYGFFGVKVVHVMLIMLVPALLGILVMLLWLQILFFGLLGGSVKRDLRELAANKPGFQQSVADRKQALGPWKAHAIIAIILIFITFILFHTRRPGLYRGWEWAVNSGVEVGLSAPAILMAVLFFAIPANYLFCRYYVCREPEKPGTAPSLLSWKAVANNTPWADIFMLGAAFACVYCGKMSGFFKAVADSVTGVERGHAGQFLSGIAFGTLFSALAPATTLAKLAIPVMSSAGSNFAFPFAMALHNQLLLPTSCPANLIIAGWGNIRPFQFLLAGIVPALFLMIMIAAFTWVFFDMAQPI